MMEANFLSVRSLFQTALGRNPHELRFRFAGPAPPHWRKAELALGEPLGYDAPTNRVQIPRGWATTQSVTADARLHQNAIAELQTSLTHVHDPDYLKARVERLLQSMPEGLTDVVDAARSLGLSRRTLARRLADGGVDFRSMLDAERRERALKLKAAGFSRTEIAERLGYQDPTSFSRAWRRWRDQTAASGDPPPG
jgi:AraC-like DNA-binding protein